MCRCAVMCCFVLCCVVVRVGEWLLHCCRMRGQHQRFRVRPQSVEVREGEDVFLECIVEHQQGKAQWTKDGFALGFERLVPGYPRYYYEGDPARGEHHLLITGVTLTEDGEYQCQVGPTAISPPIWAAANVTVILAPSSVTIVGWENGAVVEVMVGSSLTLECLVADARPAPGAVWYRAGRKVDPDLQEDRVEASSLARRWSLRSQLVVQATAADDGKGLRLPRPASRPARHAPRPARQHHSLCPAPTRPSHHHGLRDRRNFAGRGEAHLNLPRLRRKPAPLGLVVP
ncbi:nephrin-like [Scylla paramamosain]|uniref:nephrin-like n=1 Tax=Scylla paramamosain TaxID=85552 RepID=UPI003082788E